MRIFLGDSAGDRRTVSSEPAVSLAQVQQLVAQLPLAAYMCDAKGLISYYNSYAVEFWGREPDPGETRWIEATVARSLRVASVYVPNGRALGTPAFAAKLSFLEAMARRAKLLADGPTLIAGDMNVCPTDQDVWDVTRVHGATHITADERSRLQAVIDAGFFDAYRRLEPDETGFTWWDYRAGHFHKGFGLRIDLALVSRRLADRLVRAAVDRSYRKPPKVREQKPSDHAPLIIDLSDAA